MVRKVWLIEQGKILRPSLRRMSAKEERGFFRNLSFPELARRALAPLKKARARHRRQLLLRHAER
jgi:hypothetical protein